MTVKNLVSKTSKVIGVDFINQSENITLSDCEILKLNQSTYLNSGIFPNQESQAISFNGKQNVSGLFFEKNNIKYS